MYECMSCHATFEKPSFTDTSETVDDKALVAKLTFRHDPVCPFCFSLRIEQREGLGV